VRSGFDGVQQKEAGGLGEGQRPQHHRLHQAEHQRVAADGQPQREHRGGGEGRIAAHQAQGEAQILRQHFQPPPAPHAAALFLQQRGVAELPPGGQARFGVRHAGVAVLLRLEFQVGPHLLFQLAVQTVAMNEGRESPAKSTEPLAHGRSFPAYAGSITRSIASDTRRYPEISAASCLRPSGVSR
jgi:hypothetical protein